MHVLTQALGYHHQLRRQLRLVRSSLTDDSAKTLVHAFVSSRLDYCKVCCIASVVGCWGSCRRCRTPRRVLWRGQESSTTSRQCWTNSIGCPWYSVCGSSWRWLFSSVSMVWHRPTSPTTASLCRPWLVDVRCGPPTPEPCTFHGLVLPSAPGTFAVAGPCVRNSLPPELRMLNCTVCTFAAKLKTFLFLAVSASENFWSRAI